MSSNTSENDTYSNYASSDYSSPYENSSESEFVVERELIDIYDTDTLKRSLRNTKTSYDKRCILDWYVESAMKEKNAYIIEQYIKIAHNCLYNPSNFDHMILNMIPRNFPELTPEELQKWMDSGLYSEQNIIELYLYQEWIKVNPDTIAFLLEQGAQPTSRYVDDGDNLLLTEVLNQNNTKLLKILLEYVDVDRNIFNKAPLECKIVILNMIHHDIVKPSGLLYTYGHDNYYKEVKKRHFAYKSCSAYQRMKVEYKYTMYVLSENCVILHMAMRENNMFESMVIREIMQYTTFLAAEPLRLR